MGTVTTGITTAGTMAMVITTVGANTMAGTITMADTITMATIIIAVTGTTNGARDVLGFPSAVA